MENPSNNQHMRWCEVAAINGLQLGEGAENVAFVQWWTGGQLNPHQMAAPTSFQWFSDTELFRFVCFQLVQGAGGPEYKPIMNLTLPTELWVLAEFRRTVSKNTRTKAVKTTIMLPPNNAEGINKVVVTMPYDGENGHSMLFAQAILYARDLIYACNNWWLIVRLIRDSMRHDDTIVSKNGEFLLLQSHQNQTINDQSKLTPCQNGPIKQIECFASAFFAKGQCMKSGLPELVFADVFLFVKE